MKTTVFGDPVIQPGDDLLAIWSDHFMPEDEPQLTARFIEDDPVAGWSCTITDEHGMEIEAHDFGSRAELVVYLCEQGVEVEV